MIQITGLSSFALVIYARASEERLTHPQTSLRQCFDGQHGHRICIYLLLESGVSFAALGGILARGELKFRSMKLRISTSIGANFGVLALFAVFYLRNRSQHLRCYIAIAHIQALGAEARQFMLSLGPRSGISVSGGWKRLNG